MRLSRLAVFPAIFAALSAAPAFAALGAGVDSVQSDLVRMKGAVRVTAVNDYTVHEITTSYGTTLREFAGADGVVFALAWSGPVYPDLQQVLGSYYEQFAVARSLTRTSHRQMDIDQAGLVVHNSGRLRAFVGRAWLPAKLPQNFSVDDIR